MVRHTGCFHQHCRCGDDGYRRELLVRPVNERIQYPLFFPPPLSISCWKNSLNILTTPHFDTACVEQGTYQLDHTHRLCRNVFFPRNNCSISAVNRTPTLQLPTLLQTICLHHLARLKPRATWPPTSAGASPKWKQTGAKMLRE